MLELSRNELLNIEGGSSISTFPNMQFYNKIVVFIVKTIISWF